MTKMIQEIMTPNPVTMPATATVMDAAKMMRDKNIGDVIVLDDDSVCGIVTDRDIVVRAIAQGREPKSMTLADICSKNLMTLEPESHIGDAIAVMREKALRRMPIVAGGKPVGIVSLGDLALERDRKSALADISAAPANK